MNSLSEPISRSGMVEVWAKRRSPVTAPGTPKRVLIVDDYVDIADVLGLVFEAHGFECKTAYSGATAIATARAWRPNVIVLDLSLPDQTGIDVAREIRSFSGTADAVLIAHTALVDPAVRQHAHENGFDAFCSKPIDVDYLADIIARLS